MSKILIIDAEPLVVEIGGQMRRDEGDVETADEEARVEQPVTAMDGGLTKCFARGLLDLQRQARVAIGAARDADREQAAKRDKARHDP